MSLLTLKEAQTWLREDSDDPEVLGLIELIMSAAETYLQNATGRKYDDSSSLAKLYCMVLIADWYENRELIGSQPSEKVRFTIQSMTTQLQYCDPLEP